jgi:hypothetical protein
VQDQTHSPTPNQSPTAPAPFDWEAEDVRPLPVPYRNGDGGGLPDDVLAPLRILSPKPRSVPVFLGPQEFVLHEASAEAAAEYQSASMAGARLRDGEVTMGVDAARAEPILVSHCLFKVLVDPQTGNRTEVPVPLRAILSWPARDVRPIFDRIKALSGMDEDDKPEVLRKRIARDTKRLKELEEAKAADRAAEGVGKNSSTGTGGGTGSPTDSTNP